RLGTNRFACAWRPGKVEGEAESAGVTLAQSPLCEDQLVTAHETQRFIERGAREWRKNYVSKGAVRVDRLDCATTATDFANDEISDRSGHRTCYEGLINTT